MGSFGEAPVTRIQGLERRDVVDRVATEEPLEVRLHGRPFAVIMRTPGADRELAAGFLFAERVVRSADDLGAIEHCRNGAAAAENVVNVILAVDLRERVEQALHDRRNVVANSSCGLCGRVTIESLRVDLPALGGAARLDRAALMRMPERLRSAQPLFEATGGLHAAGLFALDGALATTAEDVGRHNAVDKVVGRMLMRDALPLSVHALFVSGRTSFEIVQKAWLAGIAIVASVSAPSSLAIELAREAGVTLVGFVRDGNCNIYSHAERIV
jgi:FdhD protein